MGAVPEMSRRELAATASVAGQTFAAIEFGRFA